MKTFAYIIKLNGFNMVTPGLLFALLIRVQGGHWLVAVLVAVGLPMLLYLYLWGRQTYCILCGEPTPGMQRCLSCSMLENR